MAAPISSPAGQSLSSSETSSTTGGSGRGSTHPQVSLLGPRRGVPQQLGAAGTGLGDSAAGAALGHAGHDEVLQRVPDVRAE